MEQLSNLFSVNGGELTIDEVFNTLGKLNPGVLYLPSVTRVEVIGENGRNYVNNDRNNLVELSVQDDGRTLKLFINSRV